MKQAEELIVKLELKERRKPKIQRQIESEEKAKRKKRSEDE